MGDGEHALAPAGAWNGRASVDVAVLARDMLSAQALAALLERSASVEAEAFASAARLAGRLAARRADAVLWLAGAAAAGSMAEMHELRMRFGVSLCVLAETVDAAALRRAYAARASGIAVIARRAETDIQLVFRTLAQLLAGEVAMSPRVLDGLLAGGNGEEAIGSLSAAELAVLELVSLGLRNRAIAERLGRSPKLVEKQVGRVFAKLGLRHDEAPDADRRVMATRAYLLARAGPGASCAARA